MAAVKHTALWPPRRRRDTIPLYEAWERTPRWHPARWIGLDVRRWCNHPMTGGWEYGRSKKVAREMLHSAYGGEEPRRDEATGYMLPSITDYFKRSNVT